MPENFEAIKITISKVTKSFGMKKIISDIVALNSLSFRSFELDFFIFLFLSSFIKFWVKRLDSMLGNDKGRVLMGRMSSFILYNIEKKKFPHFTRYLLLSYLIKINNK
jgi:hypothetical protein